jgi:DNA-binding FadR family transcriptional regulator
VIGEHARIRAAMERGSPEDARAAIHDHLNSGIRRLFGS